MTGPMLEDEVVSTCSTPYVSAPSSPGRGPPPPAFFFSAPASPVHYILSSSPQTSTFAPSAADFSADFEFSARFGHGFSAATAAFMTSADELFLNGQIRPMKLSSHLQRPQNLAPLLDLEEDNDEREGGKNGGGDGAAKAVTGEKSQETSARGREVRMRGKSMHRRARSMSPLRNWRNRDGGGRDRSPSAVPDEGKAAATPADDPPSDASTPSVSASSSRSNSTSSRSSKRWVFLMDFLHRSKSEGRGRSSGGGKDKIWSSISFSPIHKEKKQSPSVSTPSSPKQKLKERPANAGAPAKKAAAKRRIPPSPHELHYTANRAQAEELRRKTYLPYRQGLLGCLGFSSRSYVAMDGLTRALNPVSSR